MDLREAYRIVALGPAVDRPLWTQAQQTVLWHLEQRALSHLREVTGCAGSSTGGGAGTEV